MCCRIRFLAVAWHLISDRFYGLIGLRCSGLFFYGRALGGGFGIRGLGLRACGCALPQLDSVHAALHPKALNTMKAQGPKETYL